MPIANLPCSRPASPQSRWQESEQWAQRKLLSIIGLAQRGETSKVLSQFNMMLTSYGLQARADEAQQLFANMRAAGVVPDVSSLNIVINALGTARRPSQALSIYHEMHALRIEAPLSIPPSVITMSLPTHDA